MELKVEVEPVYRTSLFIDLSCKEKTVIWFEVWVGNFPQKLKEKRKKEYFVRVNKKTHKSLTKLSPRTGERYKVVEEPNVHNPEYWATYLHGESVKTIDLQQSFNSFKPAVQQARLLLNKFVQDKKRTCILLCSSDDYRNHLDNLIDFLNKYQD